MAAKKKNPIQIAAEKKKAADALKKKAADTKARTVRPQYLPKDYLKGSKLKGDKYTAWKTKSGEKPDLGAGDGGPGTPYREVQKTMREEKPTTPPWGNPKPPTQRPKLSGNGAVWRRWQSGNLGKSRLNDAKTNAIARRLNNG